MNPLRQARSALAGWIAPSPGAAPATEEPVREAIFGATGIVIDEDDWQYNRLTGQTGRDLYELTQLRMQDLASWLWQSNLLARQVIEMPIAFLLARGVGITVADKEAQEVLDAWWSDPVTDVPLRLPEWMRGMKLYGEQCWPVFVHPVSGHVRFGYLDPGRIATVVRDPDNYACPVGIVTTKDRKGRARRYRIIYNGPEEMFGPKAQDIRRTMTDGECFYFRKNVLGGGRGRSDLLASIDWLDAYERFLFGEMDRSDFLRSFVWEVTLTGAKPEEVAERTRKIKTPGPGSVLVHNDTETWKPLSPTINSYDSAAAARTWRNHILGGQAIPEHWFGGGGDVNRATAAEMGSPAHKAMQLEQFFWTEVLRRCGQYVLWRFQDPRGESAPDPMAVDADLVPSVEWPEIVERDLSRHTTSLQQVATAAALAIAEGLMSEMTAVKLIASVAERLGVEIDAGEELEEAAKRVSEQAEGDTFPNPPADDGDGHGG